ncbi:MAG: hypothetical protein U9R23_07645 [Candidatus Cloacimonadota bacterium]|nr:hypothetical protein [Candidatus Cloacimonadota bacterium]
MQQILLIVLSVIIVGVAIAVGITMFKSQAVTSNRQAVITDLNSFAGQALGFYKTPIDFGGGGYTWTGDGTDDQNLGAWLGYGHDGTTGDTLTTENGTYKLIIDADKLTITGNGKEIGDKAGYPATAFGADGCVAAQVVVTGKTGAIKFTRLN